MATTVNYPCDMPLPLVARYSYTQQSQTRRNDVQVGAPRYTLLSEDAPANFNATFSFNAFQFRVFESFFKTSTIFGSLSFNIDLDVGAGNNESHECYFNDVYISEQTGQRWRVSVPLLAVQKVYETDTCNIEQILMIASYGGLSSWILAINNFADVTIPESGLGNINYGTSYV